ncbi:hypothetical protein CerSpe_042960 [Prunus speciosa]
MIGPIFKTDGFGFVFPKRSLLIPNVSQAILKVTGTERILDIEKKWFKEGRNCQDLNSPKVSSNSLGLESFWVLFLISGVASILALIIFIASLIYRHGHILMHPADSEASTWRNILTMLQTFNEKDHTCHTLKFTSQSQDAVKASPSNIFPDSSVFYEAQETLTTDEPSPEIV